MKLSTNFIIILILATFVVSNSIVYADQIDSERWKAEDTQTYEITGPDNVCKKVTNASGTDIFVPIKTVGEWQAFLAAAAGANLPGISLSECGGGGTPDCSCAASTCTGSTCSDGCGGICAGTKACAICGDGICNGDETGADCPADCCVPALGYDTFGCWNLCAITPQCTNNTCYDCRPAGNGCYEWVPIVTCGGSEPPYCHVSCACCADPTCVICLLSETEIAMADNHAKNIEDINIGDYVLGYENGKTVVNKVFGVIREHIREGYYIIKLQDSRELKITNDHPIYSKNENGEGWKAVNSLASSFAYGADVGELDIGDQVLNKDEKWVAVTDIDYVEGRVSTYTLIFNQKGKNFFANGVLVAGIEREK